ncbi:MAG: hypothetical protein ACJA2A_001943 [Cycloclasticus pugetii]|jgi:hypothetical protein|uniref:Uncharacterized protein n=1 Tax=Cycloclasticus zancles 78-ME TaxID=1198232 RepID=S5TFS7_9GAMM|nr:MULTISPECIES: hypothetical protein [Cycloclasticus]AGS39702.1 hypothetical protein CYCME_1373 [Cycloclasticus zancles 78-ME]MBV1898547.1 hypothetical protein [Cycloclasticus sp.]
MPNLKILSTTRRRTFKDAPKLSSNARHSYFLIDADTRKAINILHTDINCLKSSQSIELLPKKRPGLQNSSAVKERP